MANKKKIREEYRIIDDDVKKLSLMDAINLKKRAYIRNYVKNDLPYKNELVQKLAKENKINRKEALDLEFFASLTDEERNIYYGLVAWQNAVNLLYFSENICAQIPRLADVYVEEFNFYDNYYKLVENLGKKDFQKNVGFVKTLERLGTFKKTNTMYDDPEADKNAENKFIEKLITKMDDIRYKMQNDPGFVENSKLYKQAASNAEHFFEVLDKFAVVDEQDCDLLQLNELRGQLSEILVTDSKRLDNYMLLMHDYKASHYLKTISMLKNAIPQDYLPLMRNVQAHSDRCEECMLHMEEKMQGYLSELFLGGEE